MIQSEYEVELHFRLCKSIFATLATRGIITYVHSMDEHKRNEMAKMNDMFGVRYSISVENQPYPVICTITADGCTAHAPDFPKIAIHAATLDAALLEVKQQIQKGLYQYKYPPIPTRQEQIVVPDNSVLVLVKAR